MVDEPHRRKEGVPKKNLPFLVFQVHVEQELLIYEAFPYDQQQPQNNLKVRFKKVRAEPRAGSAPGGILARAESFNAILVQVPHNINFREKKSKLKKDRKGEGGAAEESLAAKSRIARFRYFEDISGYSGVRELIVRATRRREASHAFFFFFD